MTRSASAQSIAGLMLSRAERDALIAEYTQYARTLSLEIARSLPSFLSREDLIAVGTAGLTEAASRFDPTRGVQFQTFAYYRIRGAVLDYVRKLASNDPYLRARASAEAAVDEVVQQSAAANPKNLRDGPAQAAETLFSVLQSVATVFSVTECAMALMSEQSAPDAEDHAARREAALKLRSAIETLPKKERTLIHAVYFEGTTIEEAGAAVGLSKSWASRLHARGLALLREAAADLNK